MAHPAYKGFAYPKPTPQTEIRRQRRMALCLTDRAEHAKVKARSGGRCEAVIAGERCRERAVHDHHLKSGWGVRNVGDSILAANRVHLCVTHHQQIHAKLLRVERRKGGFRWEAVR